MRLVLAIVVANIALFVIEYWRGVRMRNLTRLRSALITVYPTTPGMAVDRIAWRGWLRTRPRAYLRGGHLLDGRPVAGGHVDLPEAA